MHERTEIFRRVKRAVVKIGSGIITQDNGLNIDVIEAVSRQICVLCERGLEVLLVSSGAMSAGIRKIGLNRRPDEIPKRQAVAAVGQAGLIMEYEKAFEKYGKKVAQILLTSDGLTHRKRYLNARNTLNTLLDWGVIPIINENDTVSIEEIKFGDNDNLSAMIAILMDADILINLTDIDGLFTLDPRTHPEARLIPEITTINKDLEQIAGGIAGALGTGGMLSKVKAARKAVIAGIPMIIAKGSYPDVLLGLFAGNPIGTFFVPKQEKMTSRKCWIGFSLKPKGCLYLDDGAANALLNNGKSLLPAGVIDVEGDFGVGSPVECKHNDQVIGIGLVNYNSSAIRIIKGLQTRLILAKLGEKPYDEIIHRDNLVITNTD